MDEAFQALRPTKLELKLKCEEGLKSLNPQLNLLKTEEVLMLNLFLSPWLFCFFPFVALVVWFVGKEESNISYGQYFCTKEKANGYKVFIFPA